MKNTCIVRDGRAAGVAWYSVKPRLPRAFPFGRKSLRACNLEIEPLPQRKTSLQQHLDDEQGFSGSRLGDLLDVHCTGQCL